MLSRKKRKKLVERIRWVIFIDRLEETLDSAVRSVKE